MSEVVERRMPQFRTSLGESAIVDFAIGCGLGATCEAAIGLRSLALPAGLALLAVAMGVTANIEGDRGLLGGLDFWAWIRVTPTERLRARFAPRVRRYSSDCAFWARAA